ncbi:MAG TPA: hypothetical protein VJV22_17205 [Acidobacteriaceae bacterium]|nr:hypothetical protein [Acidobacteriaceae bacterium]
MIVVADSSPLHYLILIGQTDVLPILFNRVVIPDAVRSELTDRFAPISVDQWIRNPPQWLEIRLASSKFPDALISLDKGEREAISLAREMRADYLLADDLRARIEAERQQLVVIGTIGILQRAAASGLLDFDGAFWELAQTNFRMSPAFRKSIIDRSKKK